ncbi:MAG: hypothetical protein IAF38_09270 [Bacteroidia bacterium]|nr:hypothetical protein [Bacteroidia bacterium]
MQKFFFLIPFILLFTFFSCGNKPSETENQVSETDSIIKQELPKEKIIEKVICDNDPRFSYALYLPKNYNEKELYPLLFLFDAHAKGTLPLEKYKTLADEFGFMLACSNESKNGIASALYEEIKTAALEDLKQKVRVDPKRIYLGGFSGGARVAINLTVADPSIAGVLSNSAGFEPSRAPLRNEMAIIGLTGNEDFNWMEQNKTERSLDAYLFPHYLVEFDGKHAWAPEAAMKRALVFLDCAAKRKGSTSKNENAVKAFFDEDIAKLASLKQKNEKFLWLKMILSFYSGVYDVKKQEEDFSKLKEDAEIKKILTDNEAAQTKEAMLQNDYYKKVFEEELPWWESEIKKMNAEKKGSEKYRLNKRLLSYISLGVYMTINSPEAKADDYVSEKLIRLYSLVDPENAEWAYLSAVLKAKQGNAKAALEFLKQAVTLGFEDKDRATNQMEFQKLISAVELQAALNK